MRNYFNQIRELEVAEARLYTLVERKERLKNKMVSCTNKLKDVVAFTNVTNDKMTNYLIQLEEIDEEIKELQTDICSLRENLEKMNIVFSQYNDIESKIFILRYKEKLKVKEIARIINYSIPRIYQYLEEINKKIGIEDKDYKKL